MTVLEKLELEVARKGDKGSAWILRMLKTII